MSMYCKGCGKIIEEDADDRCFRCKAALDRITDRAMEDVAQERARQDEKWGVQRHDPERWLAILVEEVGEVAQAILGMRHNVNAGRELARAELIQVAAVAVAAVEHIDSEQVELYGKPDQVERGTA